MSAFRHSPGNGFFDKLSARATDTGSLLCVGLDPHEAELGEAANANGALCFCRQLIEQTKDVALAYKPNAAFFEQYGEDGIAALKSVAAAVPVEIPVILDVKRGDIGSTAAAYAKACFEEVQADAITLNAYMGVDTVRPFLEYPGKGLFILCKTSNPSSSELQTMRVGTQGKMLYEHVASLCSSWNDGNNVGLVVGATDPTALRGARAAGPGLWILAPGVGAQGGDLDEACAAALDSRGLGIIIPISRGISRADDPAKAATEFRDRINAARRRFMEAREDDSNAAEVVDIPPFQKSFIEFAISQKVLTFETTKLKSGRISPYYFNFGLFDSGTALAKLGKFYAGAIINAKPQLKVDVVFGPAYKGIPLAAAVALTLADSYGLDVGFTYNRKEAKDHGEGGTLVGSSMQGKTVLIIDDVMTAGTAVREAMDIVTGAGGIPIGVIIALDRQERTGAISGTGEERIEETSAIQQVEQTYHVPVLSVAKLEHVMGYLASQGDLVEGVNADKRAELRRYRDEYGAG